MNKSVYFLIFFVGLCMCLILFLCASCKTTKYVEVPHVVRDSVFQKLFVHDSIMIRDSIFVSHKGDTIREVRWKYEYRDRVIRDTINSTRVDTVGVPVTKIEYKTQEVEKPMVWYNKVFVFIGRLCCLAALAYLIFLYIKRKVC